MKYVEPIRDKRTITLILDYLKQKNYRDYLWFLVGVNTGLRISDILKLRLSDFDNDCFYIIEKKTSKPKSIPLNPILKREIHKLKKESDDPNLILFKSRQGEVEITRQRVYQILKEIEKEFRLKNIGCHSMRKTFGFMHYAKHKDVVILQEIFNHSHPSITLRYIGISREAVHESMRNFSLY